MNSREYWAERFIQLEEAKHVKGVKLTVEIERIYEEAIMKIDKDINNWYIRVAQNNKITYAEARKLLTASELKEFKWTVEEYIKYGEKNALNQAYMTMLENASAKVHISRLEALKLQTRNSIEVMCYEKEKQLSSGLSDLYKDNYYHTAFEIQTGVNLGWDLQKVNNRQVETVLKKPWAADGRNFSERIWGDKEKLINTVHKELSQAIIRGKNPQSIVKDLSKTLGASKHAVKRLVMTESAYVASASQRDCFNELDIDEFEFVATLDSKTSELCRNMDGKHFPMSQYEIGVNVPPLHVLCRSVVSPYFSDDEGFRIVGGGKNSSFIHSNMTYRDWESTYAK